MDSMKIGKLLADLRREKNLTQKQLAEKINVQSKTISKWECGLGCPDITYWSDLSNILEFDIVQIMEGEIAQNPPDNGNISKTKFYICPKCKNIITSTSPASIYCCARKLEPLEKSKENINIKVEEMDLDYYITFDHPMTKENYLSFAAIVKGDRMMLLKFYPEQSPEFRIPQIKGATLYLYSQKKGLSSYRNIHKLVEKM